jgi:hypothetical protein
MSAICILCPDPCAMQMRIAATLNSGDQFLLDIK